jgi:hypothetical protein
VHLAHRFEYDAWHTDLVERKCHCQPANAAAGDDYGIIRHTLDPIYISMNFIILWMTAVASRLRPSKRKRSEYPLLVNRYRFEHSDAALRSRCAPETGY